MKIMSKIKEIKTQILNSSVIKIIEEYLIRIEDKNNLNSYVYINSNAIQEADEADKRISQGDNKPLEGIPIGVKCLYAVENFPLTAASTILENYIAPNHSTVVKKLIDAGAIIIGLHNCDSFGMGSGNIYSNYGPALNPICNQGQKTIAGGSSGGTAAAVKADLCVVGIGSDTGGSCRNPAAYTGTIGSKLTYGRISRNGLIGYGASLDCPGIITKTVEDNILIAEILSGYDPLDAQTYNCEWKFQEILDLKYCHYDLEKWNLDLKDSEFYDISCVLDICVECYMLIATAEAVSNLERYDGIRFGRRAKPPYKNLKDFYAKTRSEGFNEEVQKRILLGNYVLKNEALVYHKAAQVRQWITDWMNKHIWSKYDILLLPTSLIEAPILDEFQNLDCQLIYESDKYTVLANLLGAPAISIPVGLSSNNMPMGIQIIAKPFNENAMFSAAKELEKHLKADKIIC